MNSEYKYDGVMFLTPSRKQIWYFLYGGKGGDGDTQYSVHQWHPSSKASTAHTSNLTFYTEKTLALKKDFSTRGDAEWLIIGNMYELHDAIKEVLYDEKKSEE